MRKKLPASFYLHHDVVELSKSLIGKVLVTNFNNRLTSGIIVETEAYNGAIDKASHAFNNRRTPRNEMMFAKGGMAYVYICYGVHHLFNVVTNKKEVPHAILIRALEPLEGVDIMVQRRNFSTVNYVLTKGPGALAVAMGINKQHSGIDLLGNEIFIEDRGIIIPDIKTSPRIGVKSAGKDALLNYRFYQKNSKWVSGKK